MITVHFYDAKTGRIAAGFKVFPSYKKDLIDANTPTGMKPILGVTDSSRQRVDIDTGLIVEAEAEMHITRAQARVDAQVEVGRLEGRSLRRIRELLLQLTGDPLLQSIEEEIVPKRADLNNQRLL